MRKYHLGLIIILILSFHSTATAQFSNYEAEIFPSPHVLTYPFTERELETASPFDPNIIRRTFVAVARQMCISLKPDVSFPLVVVSTDIPVEKIHEYIGIEIESNMINYFGYRKNTILLMKDSKIHTLAHEMVHYFQFHYHLHGDINQLTYDPEPEAVLIQNFFRPGRKVTTASTE
jgi:hypothetical protein